VKITAGEEELRRKKRAKEHMRKDGEDAVREIRQESRV